MASKGAIKTGQGYFELFLDSKKLEQGLLAASAKLKQIGNSVASIGKGLLTAGAALSAPFIASAKVFADYGSSVYDASQRTGLSAEAISELGFIAEQSGSSVKQLETSLNKMQVTIAKAASGSKQATDALAKLNLSVGQLQGLSPEDQFTLIGERLAGIEDPSQRAAIAMQVLGRSGRALLPLFAEGADGMAKMRQQARELGISLSSEQAAAADKLGDAYDTMLKAVRGVAVQVGAALAPALEDAGQKIIEATGKVTAFVKENQGLIVSALKIAGVLAAAGAGLFVFGKLMVAIGVPLRLFAFGIAAAGSLISGTFALIGTAATTMGAILTTVLSSPVLLIGAIVAAVATLTAAWTGAFEGLSATATTAFEGISNIIAGVVSDVRAAAGAIGRALASGDIATAGKILWLTLKLEFTKGVNAINKIWQSWKVFFLDIFNSVAFGISDTWAKVVSGMQVAILVFKAAVVNAWNGIAEFFQKLFIRIRGLFDSSIDVDAEVEKIKTKYADKRVARDKATLDEVARINEETQSFLQASRQARQEESDKIAERGQLSTRATEEALEKVRSEFQKFTEEKKSVGGEGVAPSFGLGLLTQLGVQDALEKAKTATASTSKLASAGGTFSGNVSQIFGTGAGADTPVRVAKQQLEEQKQARKELIAVRDAILNTPMLTWG